jgi:AcrR family transcriptional regulator
MSAMSDRYTPEQKSDRRKERGPAMAKSLSRRERKKIASKEKIFKKAIYFFRTKGFDETNINEITDDLDLSRATFFNYFTSKNQVLHELAIRTVQNYKDILLKKFASDTNTHKTLFTVMDEIEDSMKGYKGLFQSVFLELMRTQVGFVKGESDKGQPTVNDLMAKIIIRGQERGEILKQDPHLLAEMLTGCLFNIILNWLHTKEPYSLKKRLKDCTNIFLKSTDIKDIQADQNNALKSEHLERLFEAFEDLKAAMSK